MLRTIIQCFFFGVKKTCNTYFFIFSIVVCKQTNSWQKFFRTKKNQFSIGQGSIFVVPLIAIFKGRIRVSKEKQQKEGRKMEGGEGRELNTTTMLRVKYLSKSRPSLLLLKQMMVMRQSKRRGAQGTFLTKCQLLYYTQGKTVFARQVATPFWVTTCLKQQNQISNVALANIAIFAVLL